MCVVIDDHDDYKHDGDDQTWLTADMEFVKNFTPPDFQAKNFTPSISTNFNSFSKNTKNE